MARTMPEAAGKLTYDDLLLFPEDGKRREIIDGELHVSAAPSLKHQWVLRDLFVALHDFVQASGLGEVFFAPLDIVFDPHDVVEPDILFVSRERAPRLTLRNVQGSPDLVIEVLSPSSRRYDEVVKRALYERTEVVEYWLVDPDAETVKLYRRAAEGGFARPVLLSSADDDALTTALLPGFRLRLRPLFRLPLAE